LPATQRHTLEAVVRAEAPTWSGRVEEISLRFVTSHVRTTPTIGLMPLPGPPYKMACRKQTIRIRQRTVGMFCSAAAATISSGDASPRNE